MEQKKEAEVGEDLNWEGDCSKGKEGDYDDSVKDHNHVSLKEGQNDSEGGDSSDDELVDLPKELEALKNKVYKFPDELEAEVAKRGYPDLLVVLDPKSGKPRLKMTSGAHDYVRKSLADEFNLFWGKNRWGIACGNANIFIQPMPGRKATRRKPDIALWGYSKCVFTKKDVVFQFSWGNKKTYELKAIDDIMNRVMVLALAHEPNNEASKLGFLVKVYTDGNKRTANGRKILRSVDVFRLPRGTTTADAESNLNGASKVSYAPGQQDVGLEITAQDLGINGLWAMFCSAPFKISVKEIYESLK